MNADTLLENFEILAEAPGGISRLRELVIALAVSGQIVKMRMHDDDTVDDLLQCTAGEVDPYPEMSEKRFDIPLHWTWVPLASIARHQLGKMLNTGKMKGERVKYLRSVNVRQDGRIDLSDVKEMLIPIDELEKYSVKLDDVFVNEGGDVGRNAIWLIESEERFAFQNQLHRLRPICGVSSRYLQLVFRDAKSRGVIAELSSGVTIQHFSASSIRKLAIPLPPLAEQKRIVAKVDELMALCDQLEQQQRLRDNLRIATRKSAIDAISTATTPEELETAWKRINSNWEVIADTPESVGTLRQLLLDLAVRGLLVSQSRNDQAAIEFLKKFSKKLERLPDVRGDVPFQIPESWIWVTFSEISKNRDSERIPLSKLSRENRKGKFDYYGASGVIDSIDDYLFDKPLLLIGEDGANLVNRSTPIAFIATGKYWVNNHAHVIDSFDTDALKYLALAINQMDLKPFLTGTAQPKLNQAKLNKLRIPLPPHAEQKRIVAKVDELMALCDQLEARLKVRSEVAEKFARSVVNAA